MQKKKKTIITLAILVVLAIIALFLIKSCHKEEPHVHTYKINEQGTWVCEEDGDILSNTDEPYVALLVDEQPKDICMVSDLPSKKMNFGNGTIYREDNAIYYYGNNAQTVIIKTEKSKISDIYDRVIINAPNDNVYHYGASTVICLDAVATTSHYEYGEVDLMTLTKARIVLENPSDVKEIYLDINNSNYKYDTSIIALKEDVNLPRLTRGAVELEEGEVKTLAIVQNLKEEVEKTIDPSTNEEVETVKDVLAKDQDYVKIENVRKSHDELIIEAFLSPNYDELDKTKTTNQSESTVTLEEAKEGSSHPASKNVFESKDDKVIETIEPNHKKEEVKEVVKYTPVVKEEEVKVEPSTPSHSHSYGDWYLLDSDYHARDCACGKVDKQSHIDNNVDNICDVCGYESGTSIWNKSQNKFYVSFADAFDNDGIANGDTIALLKDLDIDSGIAVNKDVIIDGNGKNITNLNENDNIANNIKVAIIGGNFSNCTFKGSGSQIIIRGGTFDFDPNNYILSTYKNHYKITNNNNIYTVSDQEIYIYNSNNLLVDRLSLGEFRDNVNLGNTYKNYISMVQRKCDYSDVDWIPIGLHIYGSTRKTFDGIFNGNNKEIIVKNDEIKCCDYFGFFGYVCNLNSTYPRKRIYDLILNVDFTCSKTYMYYNAVGGLVSEIYGWVNIDNVTIKGSISSNRMAGGLVGNIYNSSNILSYEITNCKVEADLNAFSVFDSDNWLAIGGIVGQNDCNGTGTVISNCSYTGKITTDFTGHTTNASSYLGYVMAKGSNDGGSEVTTITNFTVGSGSSITGYQNVTTHNYPFEGYNTNDGGSNTYTGNPNPNKQLVGGYFYKCTIDGVETSEATTTHSQNFYPHGTSN